MKVGIMTFIDEKNYGNRLQNYALQEFLKGQGFEVETIRNDKFYDYYLVSNSIKEKTIKHLKRFFFSVYRMIDKTDSLQGYEISSNKNMKKRICANKQFTKEHIKQSNVMLRDGDDYYRKLSEYEYIFIGSDQVWNPQMAGASELFFLPKIESKRKIAFAASIGVDTIPSNYKKQWDCYCSTIDKITVREQSAVEILKKSNKDAKKILDPTLLIGKRKYDELADKSNFNFENKYIATYLLGEDNSEYLNSIKKIASEKNADIVEINNLDNTFGVYDFLKIIRGAEMIITDSFHACIFSIIFSKEFFVLKRKGEYKNICSRIEDLMKTFEIEGREVDRIEDIKDLECLGLLEQQEKIQSVINMNKQETINFIHESCERNE